MTTRASKKTIELPLSTLAAALVAALGLLLPGCGSDADAKTQEPLPAACTGGVLEADLQANPLSGAGVDPGTGELLPPPEGSSYTISSTYGVPKPGADAMERYMMMFGAVQTQLASQPGLVALQLAQSPSCGSGRTLAVWSSTESMYDFVMSSAHLAAVDAVDELVEPNYAVTHWETSNVDEMTLEEGVRRIAALEPSSR
jgi:heme-degrading monooxygenase HmoA